MPHRDAAPHVSRRTAPPVDPNPGAMRWFDAIWAISVPPIAPRALRREPASRGGKLILGAKRPIFWLWLLGWADPVVGTRGMTRPPRVSHPHTRIAPGRRRCSRLHAWRSPPSHPQSRRGSPRVARASPRPNDPARDSERFAIAPSSRPSLDAPTAPSWSAPRPSTPRSATSLRNPRKP